VTDYSIAVKTSQTPPVVSMTGGVGGAPAFTPADMAGAFLWAGAGVLVGSPADSFTDQVGAGDFEAAGAARPAVTAAGGTWTIDVPTFDGVNDRMASTLALLDLRFLHGDAGASAGVLFYPTATNGGGVFLLATSNGSSSNVGLEIWYYGDHLVVQVVNGVAAQAPFSVDIAALVTLNTKHHCFVRHKAGEANEYEIYFDGVLVANGSYAFARSAADSTGALTIGNAPSVSYPYTGDIAEVVLCNDYASNADRDALFDYWDAL
jgi:hypothetical protein